MTLSWPHWVLLLVCIAEGYLLGSINSAIIITGLFQKKGDIREQGSGNAGMTNVLRTVGKLPALLTFIGDFVKCVAAVLLAILLFSAAGPEKAPLLPYARFAAGAACVMGHMFPVFYGFRGGKGIVTSAAMMAMTDWRVFLIILATFLAAFLVRRIVSLGSVICAALYPIYTFLIIFRVDIPRGNADGTYLIFAVLLALFVAGVVLIRHRANIGRLKRGEEKPVSFGNREKKTS